MAGKITLAHVLERSGLHPKILDFAMFNGYRLPVADQTLDEQVVTLQQRFAGLKQEDAIVMLGDQLNADVAEFFNQKFPVVGSGRAA